METSPLNESYGVSYTESKSLTENAEPESAFICNVCLEITNKDPVVTQCGHLYCWPCLYRWLNTNHSTCPVCKAGVTRENVIPLFIRGNEEDPRSKTPASANRAGETVPNRPLGHRPEPTNGENNAAIGNVNNVPYGVVTFSAGFGFFPSLFGLQFQSFPAAASTQLNRALTDEEIQQIQLSRALFVLGSLVVMALILF